MGFTAVESVVVEDIVKGAKECWTGPNEWAEIVDSAGDFFEEFGGNAIGT